MAASNECYLVVFWFCFIFLSFLLRKMHVLFVLVGGEPGLGGTFNFLIFFFVLSCFVLFVSCRISSGGARPPCVSILTQALGNYFVFPSLVFPCY